MRECFDYDPNTGALIWKTRPEHHFKNASPAQKAFWNRRFPGKKAGSTSNEGYIVVCIDDVPYQAHRIIWKMQTGKQPTRIDHKNGDCGDNRWHNLREATPQQNTWNSRVHHVRDLPKGVERLGDRCVRYRARLVARIKGKRVLLTIGRFDTPEEAHKAWRKAARKQRGDFFRAE